MLNYDSSSISGWTNSTPKTMIWITTKDKAAKAVLARPSTAAWTKASKSTSFFAGLTLLRTLATLSGVAILAPLCAHYFWERG